jgi:hypothetical protein
MNKKREVEKLVMERLVTSPKTGSRGRRCPRGAEKHFVVLLGGQVNVEVLLVDNSIVARSPMVLLGCNLGGP